MAGPLVQILGIRFFNGDAGEAVANVVGNRGIDRRPGGTGIDEAKI